jgi:hypothetical protein
MLGGSVAIRAKGKICYPLLLEEAGVRLLVRSTPLSQANISSVSPAPSLFITCFWEPPLTRLPNKPLFGEPKPPPTDPAYKTKQIVDEEKEVKRPRVGLEFL